MMRLGFMTGMFVVGIGIYINVNVTHTHIQSSLGAWRLFIHLLSIRNVRCGCKNNTK